MNTDISSRAKASFVIATRNRIAELRNLLRSILAQTVPVEILVMDDEGSSTLKEMIADDFPEVRYFHVGTARGPAYQRNRGIELASTEMVFAIDDDTILQSPNTVEQTLSDFDDPRVGAVAIPYVNVFHDGQLQQSAPDKHSWLVHAYVGASHAVRRSVFLDVGGYRDEFFYMGEEGDVCLRMLAAGFVVRLGTSDAIHHLESPRRSVARANYYGRRNDVLFAWCNVPLIFLPFHLVATTVNGLRTAFRAHSPVSMLRGTAQGYCDIVRGRTRRQAVPASVYLLYRRLKKTGPQRLDLIRTRIESTTPSVP